MGAPGGMPRNRPEMPLETIHPPLWGYTLTGGPIVALARNPSLGVSKRDNVRRVQVTRGLTPYLPCDKSQGTNMRRRFLITDGLARGDARAMRARVPASPPNGAHAPRGLHEQA